MTFLEVDPQIEERVDLGVKTIRSKVYCQNCKWYRPEKAGALFCTTDACMHDNALADSYIKPNEYRKSPRERNASNHCPDFARKQ